MVEKCVGCEKVDPSVKRRRQNTNYVEDESNFATLCADCQKEADAYWSDMWADYYAGCM